MCIHNFSISFSILIIKIIVICAITSKTQSKIILMKVKSFVLFSLNWVTIPDVVRAMNKITNIQSQQRPATEIDFFPCFNGARKYRVLYLLFPIFSFCFKNNDYNTSTEY